MVRCNDLRVDLTIVHLGGTHTYLEIIDKPFDAGSGFNSSWWGDYAKGPVEFFNFVSDRHGEVARALTRPMSSVGDGYPSFKRPERSLTELELFEVRSSVRDGLRGPRYGTLCVDLLLKEYPADYYGLSADTETDRFWSRIGWEPHYHAEAGGPSDRWKTLFVPAC